MTRFKPFVFLVILSILIIQCNMVSTLSAGDTSGSEPAEAIIIDHTTTDLNQIPDYWLEAAQQLAIHYAHTSHGSQIISGLRALHQIDPKYNFSVFMAGNLPPTTLDCSPESLCIYDGNPPETYIEPDDYWATVGGVARTWAVASTGLFDFSLWAWCGQQSTNEVSTVDLYLSRMSAFESQFPDKRFILMTGHTDGGSETLERNNDMVRQFAREHGKVLFDFADIESYDPDGNYYPDTSDNCAWCSDWCDSHPQDCAVLPESCAHSHPFNCLQKGKAFWWMMARLAGWDGQSQGAISHKSASNSQATFGETITYTVSIQGLSAPLGSQVYMTDTLPAGLDYLQNSLTASQGSVDDSQASLLKWSGTLDSSTPITITYATRVTESAPAPINNRVEVNAPGYDQLALEALVWANPQLVFMPSIFENQ